MNRVRSKISNTQPFLRIAGEVPALGPFNSHFNSHLKSYINTVYLKSVSLISGKKSTERVLVSEEFEVTGLSQNIICSNANVSGVC